MPVEQSHTQLIPVQAVLDAAGLLAVLSLGVVSAALLRQRPAPSATPLGLFAASVTLWAVVDTVPSIPGVPGAVAGIETYVLPVAGTFCVFSGPVLWFWYVVAYTGRGAGLTRRRFALLTAPAVATVPVSYVLLTATGPVPALVNSAVTVFVPVVALYALALLLLGAYLLVRLWTTYRQVSFGQVGALVAATAAPYVASLASNVTQAQNGEMVPLLGVDATPLGFLAAGGLLGVGVWRYPVVGVLPEAEAIARDDVVEQLQEAVFVLDRRGEILDLNATAAAIAEQSSTATLGTQLASVLGTNASELDAPTRPVDVETAAGTRQFDATVSALGERDDPVGRTVVLRDVTDRETREQRLQVLNRVLRHSLRNDLDVILAHAGTVADPETRAAIRGPAERLVEKAKKARDTERLLEVDSTETNPVDVGRVARAVAERQRVACENCEITVDAPEAASVQSRAKVLEHALTELVENAVRHSDTDGPRVEVRITCDDTAGEFELSVADVGPGIPEREQRVLRDGAESQQRHGSGVGLWLVDHAVSHLGGDLSFAENDPRGSVVTVRLPDGGP